MEADMRPDHDPEIMTWSEIKNQILNGLKHPGIPIFNYPISEH